MIEKYKEPIEWFLGMVEKIAPKTRNQELYRQTFDEMTDAEFEKVLDRIESGDLILPVFIENMSQTPLSQDRAMAVGEELGVEYFQHLILTDPITGEEYQTPEKYLVLMLPVRRQIQHLVKKMSTAEDNKTISLLSGQATGDSKTASMSTPELLVLNSKGYEASLIELIKPRGGDETAYRAMEQSIAETGGWSLDPILELKSKPKATHTLRALLLGMHLDSNLVDTSSGSPSDGTR